MSRPWRTAFWLRAVVLCCATSHGLSAQSAATRILDRVQVDSRRPIDFHAAAFPDTVFVGQQVTYQVAVFLNADARSRLRRNPEFLPPELRGLLAYELGAPTRIPPQNINGSVYEAHVFQRALFAVAAGPVSVAAPQLTYALPQSSSYFSREERFVVHAESAQLVVRPIPTTGRPDNFTGAIGVFTASARLDSAAARVGDPLIYTLRIQGIGNMKLLPRPLLEVDWASAVPATERVRVDTAGPLVRGTKEFDWILTPSRDGRVQMPVVRYGYFDPYQERFADAEAAALSVEVKPGVLVASEDGESTSLLPLRDVNARVRPMQRLAASLRDAPFLLLAVLVAAPVPLVVLLLVGFVQGQRAARASVPLAAPLQLAQLEQRDSGSISDARSVRRVLHTAIADRLQVAPGAIVTERQIRRVMRRRGVTRATTEAVVALLSELDEHAFSGKAASTIDASPSRLANHRVSAPSPLPVGTLTTDALREWAHRSRDLLAAVNAEAVRSGGRLPPDRGGALVIVVFGMACAFAIGVDLRAQSSTPIRAQPPTAPVARVTTVIDASAVAEATQSYRRRMFAQASAQFAELARKHATSSDLLANWGTASWAAGDTVHAVIGWQRATRLDPLDGSLQERLGLLPSGARTGVAEVPLVPVPALLVVGALAWILGWALLAVDVHQSKRAGGRPATRWPRSVAIVLLLAACAAGGTAWWGWRLLDAEGLAVVVRPETLHVAPGTDADALGGVSTGDVVRKIDEREGWQHVRHADGRVGWLQKNRLIALLDATPSR